jgi:hypothetical protein
MKKLFLLFPVMMILCPISFQDCFSQTVISEKAVFHLNNSKIKTPEVKIIQPILLTDKTNTFEVDVLKLFGKLVNGTGKQKIMVNKKPATIFSDSLFYADVSLLPGSNNLTIDVISDDRIVNYSFFNVYRIVSQVNLAIPSINYGKYYALIIGINHYSDPSINSLEKPVKDATELYDVLTSKYVFEKENVTLLPNPTRREIIGELDKLSKKVMSEDNLLIFYAGHGTYEATANIGYWLASDASKESTAEWFSNSTLTDELKRIKSKHTLVVSDACFSGSIFVSRSAFVDASQTIEKAYALKSRQAMTSGSLYEVPDNSVFLYYLLDRLRNNKDKYMTAEQLFINIKTAVQNNGQVEAKFGDIQGVGHEGGDFVFIMKKNDTEIK